MNKTLLDLAVSAYGHIISGLTLMQAHIAFQGGFLAVQIFCRLSYHCNLK